MTIERIRALDELGFCWEHKTDIWALRYQELLDFVKENGHSIVPSAYPPDPKLAKLANWVKCQRRQKKLFDAGKPNTLTPERLQLLNEARFSWSANV